MSAVAHHKKIAHLKKSDPILGAVIEATTLREITITRAPFEALVEAIVSQQLSIKAADTIFSRLAALTPGKKFPTPRQILAIPASKMRKCGLSKMKVSFIKDLARKTLDGTLDFRHMDTMSDEEVIEHLVNVKGIGRWTAEMFLIFSLKRDDVFSFGDLGLRNGLKKIYKLKGAPTPAQAARITAKWKPYRSLGARYLWASLDNR